MTGTRRSRSAFSFFFESIKQNQLIVKLNKGVKVDSRSERSVIAFSFFILSTGTIVPLIIDFVLLNSFYY
jgi:hypothetical protein